ncbi:MAG: hypothetical protein P8I94_06155, partial [Emcibacteraceae bacterium]|nr:hypothetical protein [Emcibacteraceae bacterium]
NAKVRRLRVQRVALRTVNLPEDVLVVNTMRKPKLKNVANISGLAKPARIVVYLTTHVPESAGGWIASTS